jgi:DNA-binding CsgD family transcriptional regulator
MKATLTAERERELLIRWLAGDEAAGTEVVEAFRSWAMAIADNYSRGQHDDELRAAALEGLAHAMRKFDVKRTGRLSTFAALTVNQHLQKQLAARMRAQDHLAFCGTTAAAESVGEAPVYDPFSEGEVQESRARLVSLLINHEKLPDVTKTILYLLLTMPGANLRTVGDQVFMSREGVRNHLLRARQLIMEDETLRAAAEEAEINL